MRAQGYFSLDDLSYAVFESNGKLSPLANPDSGAKSPSVPLLLINQGKINQKNINLIKDDEKNVKQFVKENGATLKQTEVLTIDGNGRAYFKVKNQKYRIVNYPLKGGVQW